MATYVQSGWLNCSQAYDYQVGSGSTSFFYMISDSQNGRVGRDGTIYGAMLNLTGNSGVNGVGFAVARLVSGNTYTIIGKSEQFSPISGVGSYTFASPITGVLASDVLVVIQSGTSYVQLVGATKVIIDDSATARFRWYASDTNYASVTAGNSYNFSSGGSIFAVIQAAALMLPPRVMVVGDSISAGISKVNSVGVDANYRTSATTKNRDSAFALTMFRDKLNMTVELGGNRMQSNNLSEVLNADILAATTPTLLSKRPSILYVHCGINDILDFVWASNWYGTNPVTPGSPTEAEIIAATTTHTNMLSSILSTCTANGMQMIIDEIFPWTGNAANTSGNDLQERIRERWNSARATWATANNVKMLTGFSAGLGVERTQAKTGDPAPPHGNWWGLNPAYDCGDTLGVHLSLDGVQQAATVGAQAYSPVVSRELRKLITVTSPTTSGVGDWVRVLLTDQTMMAQIANAGDIRVTASDGTTPVDHKVLTLTSTLAEILIWLNKPTAGASVSMYVYAGKRLGSAATFFDWGPVTQDPPSSALNIACRLSDGSTTTSLIHPSVIPVPAGSWMASDGAGHAVTHVMANTPIGSGGNNVVENPSLFYSTDDGNTWSQWPGVLNPITPNPGGSNNYNADNGLLLLANGSLRVYYRRTYNSTVTLVYKDIAGTNLSNVSVGAEQTCTMLNSSNPPTSPTFYRTATNLYCFGADSPVISGAHGCLVYRWESADEGVTWGNKTLLIFGDNGGNGGESISGYWHGGQVVLKDNWYYCAWGEITTATSHQPRLFRSRDLLNWEASKSLIMSTPPTWGSSYFYCHTLFLASDGALNLLFSATASNGLAACGKTAVTPVGHAITSSQAFGVGRATESETAAQLVAAYDFEQTQSTRDLYGVYNLVPTLGTPTITSGGLVMPAGNAYMTASPPLVLGGVGEITVEFEVTMSSLATMSGLLFASTPSRTLDFYTYINTDGTLRCRYVNASGVQLDAFSQAGVITVGNRAHVLIRYKYGEYARCWINGVYSSSSSSSFTAGNVIRSSTGQQVSFGGCLATPYLTFTGTIHRLAIWSTANRSYVVSSNPSNAPTYRWTTGVESMDFSPLKRLSAL